VNGIEWASPVVVGAFADTFKTVLGVLLALAGLGIGLMGLTAAADRSWKGGLVYVAIGIGLLAVGLRLAGAISASLDAILGAVLSVAGLIFLGLGVIAIRGPTKQQGTVALAGGAALIAGGLWIMGAL